MGESSEIRHDQGQIGGSHAEPFRQCAGVFIHRGGRQQLPLLLDGIRAGEKVGAGTELLDEACFDPDRMDELGFDPRAHDHFHPVNKRPNVLFGEWDKIVEGDVMARVELVDAPVK